MDQNQINKSITKSLDLRKIILHIAKEAGDKAAHIGGALSCIDFLSAADEVYKISSSNTALNSLVLSKGHACLALYSLMAHSGIVPLKKILNSFENDNSQFLGHPCRNTSLGINFSTGSLGNGLAHALGLALFRSKTDNSDVICILGDGECNEGIIWECFEFLSKLRLRNLLIFIDCNGWQQTQTSLYAHDNYQSLLKRLKTYDLDVSMIDGHDHKLLNKEINSKNKSSKVILGLTVKGKGYEMFENNNEWHHGVLTNSMFNDLS